MTNFFKKLIFFSVLFITLLIVTIFVFLLPAIRSYNDNKIKISEQQAVLNENYEKISNYQKIDKNPEEFNGIYKTVSGYWPNNSDISDFIVQTEGLAKDIGLTIDSFSIEEPSSNKKKAKTEDEEETTKKKTESGVKFTISSKTSYPKIFDLVRKMENLARLNSISSIAISYTEDGINLNTSGYIYYGQ